MYNSKKIAYSRIRLGGIIMGVLGMSFAKIFRNAEQSTLIIIVFIGFTLINTILSIGLLSIQRLYYLAKIEKSGYDINGSIEEC